MVMPYSSVASRSQSGFKVLVNLLKKQARLEQILEVKVHPFINRHQRNFWQLQPSLTHSDGFQAVREYIRQFIEEYRVHQLASIQLSSEIQEDILALDRVEPASMCPLMPNSILALKNIALLMNESFNQHLRDLDKLVLYLNQAKEVSAKRTTESAQIFTRETSEGFARIYRQYLSISFLNQLFKQIIEHDADQRFDAEIYRQTLDFVELERQTQGYIKQKLKLYHDALSPFA
jgi:hypothetical protein